MKPHSTLKVNGSQSLDQLITNQDHNGVLTIQQERKQKSRMRESKQTMHGAANTSSCEKDEMLFKDQDSPTNPNSNLGVQSVDSR